MIHLTSEQADAATPVAAICSYDSGSMDGCRPLCDSRPTYRLLSLMSCYGWIAEDLCNRHVKPMLGRIYPERYTVRELMVSR